MSLECSNAGELQKPNQETLPQRACLRAWACVSSSETWCIRKDSFCNYLMIIGTICYQIIYLKFWPRYTIYLDTQMQNLLLLFACRQSGLKNTWVVHWKTSAASCWMRKKVSGECVFCCFKIKPRKWVLVCFVCVMKVWIMGWWLFVFIPVT